MEKKHKIKRHKAFGQLSNTSSPNGDGNTYTNLRSKTASFLSTLNYTPARVTKAVDGRDCVVRFLTSAKTKFGLDPSRFPTVKHFTSWLGAMPVAVASSVAKLKVLRLVRLLIVQEDAFRMAAQTSGKSNSALGAFYRRLRSRLGAPKAITATAHKERTHFLQTLDNRRRLYRSWYGLL